MKLRYIIFLGILLLITPYVVNARSYDCSYSTGHDSIVLNMNVIDEYLEISLNGIKIRYSSNGNGTQIGQYKYSLGDTFTDEGNCPAIKIIESGNNRVICGMNSPQSICKSSSEGGSGTNVNATLTHSVFNNGATSPSEMSCGSLNMVWTIFGYIIFAIQIVVPLLLIVFGSLTFARAISKDNDNDIKEAQDLLIKRIIAAVVIFLMIFIAKFSIGLVIDNNSQNNIESCISCALNPFGDDCGFPKGQFVFETEGGNS